MVVCDRGWPHAPSGSGGRRRRWGLGRQRHIHTQAPHGRPSPVPTAVHAPFRSPTPPVREVTAAHEHGTAAPCPTWTPTPIRTRTRTRTHHTSTHSCPGREGIQARPPPPSNPLAPIHPPTTYPRVRAPLPLQPSRGARTGQLPRLPPGGAVLAGAGIRGVGQCQERVLVRARARATAAALLALVTGDGAPGVVVVHGGAAAPTTAHRRGHADRGVGVRSPGFLHGEGAVHGNRAGTRRARARACARDHANYGGEKWVDLQKLQA